MTFSIVARDSTTGDLAVAVQSKFLCVGSMVPWAQAGVGAVSCSAFSRLPYRFEGLSMLEGGLSAPDAVARLAAAETGHQLHQIGLVDNEGRAATYTGKSCFAWAGGRATDNVAAQGNILAGPEVVDGLFETFLAGGKRFPELLVQCLLEADGAGGDRRGRQSASLLVVRPGGAWGGSGDRWIDLRVDDHTDPIGELDRLLGLWRLYYERPDPSDLLPIDDALAADLRQRLERAGFAPGSPSDTFTPMWPDASAEAQPEGIGQPREYASGWDRDWETSLIQWMRVVNLEERAAAAGWIDPRVLTFLREQG